MPQKGYKFVGKGIYSIAEASRLIRVSKPRISRWLRGYSYLYKSEEQHQRRIIISEFEPVDNSYALSFLDLIEMRFIDSFRRHGISLKTIRIASVKAREMLDWSHPFSTKKFKTDGKTILVEIAHQERDPDLLDLIKDQYTLRKILSPYLYEGLDFEGDVGVLRWWPMAPKKRIVIDPARNFGAPILNNYGVPTATIASSVKAEGSIKAAADLYQIDARAAKDALDYEMQLAA